MGIDWHSKSIIGMRIDTPIINKKVRVCRHPEQDTNFCSDCGAPMWTGQKGLHPIIEKIESNPESFDIAYSDHHKEVFIGFYYVRASCRGGTKVQGVKLPEDLNMKYLKEELKNKLGELYKEENFGLWTMLYASY